MHDLSNTNVDAEMIISSTRMQSLLLSINRERYQFQQEDMLKNIYQKVDPNLEQNFGFSVTDCIKFHEIIASEFFSRLRRQIIVSLESILGTTPKESKQNSYNYVSKVPHKFILFN